ncbi:amidohydrolase family protein [Janibacter sp. G1551]|uniref:amidohydrolase family protein n=1 Tax=Janibacter sp. G1551 TaxID=3420440 RepID=UPI003D063538
MPLLLRDVELEGRRVDLRIDGGVVRDIAPPGVLPHGATEIDARGGAVLPGLVDHHIHLLATAAARASVDLSEPGGLTRLASAPGEGWLRAVGAGSELTRRDLAELGIDRPVRVQHRSGALWTLNDAGIEDLLTRGGASALTRVEVSTGQLWRADDRLRSLLPPAAPPDLEGLGGDLLARGVTAVTDATPTTTPEVLDLFADTLPQRVLSLARAGSGPVKVVVPDHATPRLDDLVGTFAAAHRAGRGVAVHCVTQESLVLVAVALRTAGSVPGDRIEHAAVCDDDCAALLADLGVVVVTQPSLVRRRGGDYLSACEPRDRPWLWRFAGLLAAGVPVALSSDAPYGDLDPWRTIATAVDRTTATGVVVGPAEAVPPRRALEAMLTPPEDPGGVPRSVREGVPADLCLLEGSLARALADPASVRVAATVLGGEVRFRRAVPGSA